MKALVNYTDSATTAETSPHDTKLKTPEAVMNEFKKGTAIRAEKIPDDLQAPFRGWIIEEHNTKSLVIVPLTAANQVIGNLTFASYRKERKWPDDILRRIKLIGEIIANAILRKRAHENLIEEIQLINGRIEEADYLLKQQITVFEDANNKEKNRLQVGMGVQPSELKNKKAVVIAWFPKVFTGG